MPDMWKIGPAAAVAAVMWTCVAAASAAPLRNADVGAPMTALLSGLNRVDRGVVGRCGETEVSYADYVVPGRPQDDDHASFVGFSAKDRLVIIVAYDEDDLGVPVTVYADLDGAGNVTNTWTVENAPQPCAILSQMH
jgi:hypothetical protein